MPTTSIAARLVFVDPENPSFDPGQVLVIYESIDPESPCYYYAVYENVTWFNPRLKFTPFADRRKCYNNQFRLIEANAVALAMQPKKCIHVWATMKYGSFNPGCLAQEYPGPADPPGSMNHDPYAGDRKIFNIPEGEGIPAAFQLSLSGLTIGPDDPQSGDDWITGDFWKFLDPQPDELYKNKKWVMPLRTEIESRIVYSTDLNEDNELVLKEDSRQVGLDAFWREPSGTVDVVYASAATFSPCIPSVDPVEYPGGWNAGEIPPLYFGRVQIFVSTYLVPSETSPDHEYVHGANAVNSLSIDAAAYMTGDSTIQLLEPRNCHIVSQYSGGTQDAGYFYLPAEFKLNVTGVRLEPVY